MATAIALAPATPSQQEVHKVRQYYRQNESHVRNSKLMLSLAQRSGSQVSTHSYIDPDTWSALEDRVLMRAEELKSDAVALYMSHHKSNPDQFPKAFLSDNDIRGRLLELRNQSRRVKLLKCISDEALRGAANSPSSAGSPSNRVHTGLSALVPAKGSRMNMSTPGVNHLEGGGRNSNQSDTGMFTPSASGAKDDLVLRCVSRGGVDNDEILANEAKVCQQSPFLAEILHQSVSTLQVNDLGLRVVELDESSELWGSIKDMHRVFAPDNVLRFVHYSRKPEMLDVKLMTDEKLKKARAEQGKDWDEFVLGVKSSKTKQVDALKQRSLEEQEAVRTEFSESLEADLECVRQIYQIHVDRELELLKVAQQKRLDATTRFFEDELQTLESLSLSVEVPQVAELTQEAARAEAMVDAVLPKEGLPRLLMLADVLRCSDLRTACSREIARGIQHFGTNHQMRSELLRHTTLTELLSKVEDDRLSSLFKMKDRCGFPAQLVKDEWMLRQQSVVAECETLGTIELMDKWKKLPPDSVWQQTIYGVLEARQKSYKAEAASRSFVVPKTQHRLVEIGTSTIEVTAPFHYVTAELRLGLRVGEGVRKGFWECRVPLLSKGSTLVIGFECSGLRKPAPPPEAGPTKGGKLPSPSRSASPGAAGRDTSVSFPGTVHQSTSSMSLGIGAPGGDTTWGDKEAPLGTAASPNGGFGCGLSNEGLLYVRGSVEDARGGFLAGDIIGVGIDQLTGNMIFTKNGTLMAMPRNLAPQVTGKEEVVPCITMYGTNLASIAASSAIASSDSSEKADSNGAMRVGTGMGDVGGHKLVKVAVETEHQFTHVPPSGYRPLSAIAKPLLEQ